MNTPIAAVPPRSVSLTGLFNRIVAPKPASRGFPSADLRSSSAARILSKRRQGWTIALRTRNVAALQSFVRIDELRAERARVTITDRQHAIESPEADSETAFWLAISRVPYIGPARIDRLLQTFGSLAVAWSAPREELRAALEPRHSRNCSPRESGSTRRRAREAQG